MHTVLAIQQGKEKAFRQLYSQYHDKLYYWLLGKMKSEYWAQELVQQTFVKLWISRENLSTTINIDIQLFRIARSLMIDQLRKLANERKVLHQLPPVQESEDVVWNNYSAKVTRQTIEQIISELPETARQAFRLSRERGLTYHEIASELSISPKTVEYHISRVLSLLRKSLTVILLALFH
ncbi:sigma-70 family RNA polymerase sigma factor [Chitinophaga sp. 212800010-3]|uniref:sigma-70 family RNA polymerase sigma factor n=1 Tax=unclassified Chitinophaga TaxID=2619133 RepID=UPI002DE8E1A8|nr:HTH luxR-type domain-containing protein [Chitinophaga sp. 212800010-3]